ILIDVGLALAERAGGHPLAGDFAPADIERDRDRAGESVQEIVDGRLDPRPEIERRVPGAVVPVDDEGHSGRIRRAPGCGRGIAADSRTAAGQAAAVLSVRREIDEAATRDRRRGGEIAEELLGYC